ncbi:MAG: site-specific integrase [Alphaproteobacteria bacterium]|nr:site-specific integrase [Alphaproteobacteria bacterium]
MRIFRRNNSTKWWVDWTDQKGRRHRKSTGTDDKKLAEALAAKWTQESFLEQHFGVIPDVPFKDALLRYGQERLRDNPVSYKASVKSRLQRLLDRFGDLNLSDITHAVIREWMDERLDEVKPASALRDMSTLRAIMNKAFREDLLAHVPPFPRFKKPQGRCRWLTVEEERRLLMASKPHQRALIAFALDTGGRRGELLKLDWQNVDLERGFVAFLKTKNGEDRSVRLTDRAKRVLEGLDPKEAGPVFTYRGAAMTDVSTAFQKARKRAGLEDVRFHDLRHTFASRLVQQGVSLYEVMHLTGHKSFSMVQRYAHLAPDFQERAIAALNAYGTVSAQSA